MKEKEKPTEEQKNIQEEIEKRIEKYPAETKDYIRKYLATAGRDFCNGIKLDEIPTIINEILAKKKSEKRERINSQIIHQYLDEKYIPHIEHNMQYSNQQESLKEETPCYIKAFTIEFILKTILTVKDGSGKINSNKEEQIQRQLSELWKKDYKKNGTGHEINEILENLIPQHMKNVIRLGALSNLNDETVRDTGLVDASNMTNFVFDYKVMLKAMTNSEISYYSSQMDSLTQILEHNNKTFEEARYLKIRLTKDDFICLNCFMVSSYAFLKFVLDYPEIIQKFNGIIPYEMIGKSTSLTSHRETITQEEYDEIVKLYQGQSDYQNKTNSLLTYLLFLKHSLKDRMPEITPERIQNIKSNLEQLQNAPKSKKSQDTQEDDKTNKIPSLNYSIDPINVYSLSIDEINELAKINPQYVYQRLVNNDKIVFYECQRYGIRYEPYYSKHYEMFSYIAKNYGKYFKSKAIDEIILSRDKDQIKEDLNQLAEKTKQKSTDKDFDDRFSNALQFYIFKLKYPKLYSDLLKTNIIFDTEFDKFYFLEKLELFATKEGSLRKKEFNPEIKIIPGMRAIPLQQRQKSKVYIRNFMKEITQNQDDTQQNLDFEEKFLYFKAPGEIKYIINLYKKYISEAQKPIPFYPELLYFPTDVLTNNMVEALNKIDDARKVEREYSYEEAQKISKKIMRESHKKRTFSSTKEKAEYVNKLLKSGKIRTTDEFLKFFNGSESSAKSVYTAYLNGHGGSNEARNILRALEDPCKIIAYLKENQIPHIEDNMRVSNYPGVQQGQTPCYIKAYTIEFILKTISSIKDRTKILENLSQQEKESYDFQTAIENFWFAEYKIKNNGHVINDLLNTIIPKHLQNVIRLGALSNLNDAAVRGTELVDASNMTNFVFDYNILQSNMTHEEIAYYNNQMKFLNQKLKKNNTTFQDARYLDVESNIDDFICLNCFMTSSYTALKFMMDYPELIQNYNGIIPYEMVGKSTSKASYIETITQEEYAEIVKLYEEQPDNINKTNSLLTYLLFLKHSLKDRMPPITPERLRNIKENIEKLQVAPPSEENQTDASTEKTTGVKQAEKKEPEYKLDIDDNFKININCLNINELNELIKINPQFVYEQLSTNNKIVLETCQRYGIRFEKYYQYDFDKFRYILENYGEYFKDKSIDPTFLLEEEHTTIARLELYKKYNQLGNVPPYYFRFSPDELSMAFESFHTSLPDSNIMSEEYIEKTLIRNKLRKENPEMSAEELEENIEIEYQKLREKRIEEKKDLDVSRLRLSYNGILYKMKPSIHDRDFKKKAITFLNKKYHTDLTDYLIDLDENELNSIMTYNSYYKTHNLNPREHLPALKIKRITLVPQDAINSELILSKPKQRIEIEPGMKAIPQIERLKSLYWLKSLEQEQKQRQKEVTNREEVNDKEQQISSLSEIQEKFLYYRTSEEVHKIVNLYRQYMQVLQNEALPFYPELLYFPMDILENNFGIVLDKIDDAYQTGRKISYEEAQKISSQKIIYEATQPRIHISSDLDLEEMLIKEKRSTTNDKKDYNLPNSTNTDLEAMFLKEGEEDTKQLMQKKEHRKIFKQAS